MQTKSENIKEVKRETATDCLIRTMGDFSQDEPTDVIICYKTEKGKVWISDNDVDELQAIGMMNCGIIGYENQISVEDSEDVEE